MEGECDKSCFGVGAHGITGGIGNTGLGHHLEVAIMAVVTDLSVEGITRGVGVDIPVSDVFKDVDLLNYRTVLEVDF